MKLINVIETGIVFVFAGIMLGPNFYSYNQTMGPPEDRFNITLYLDEPLDMNTGRVVLEGDEDDHEKEKDDDDKKDKKKEQDLLLLPEVYGDKDDYEYDDDEPWNSDGDNKGDWKDKDEDDDD